MEGLIVGFVVFVVLFIICLINHVKNNRQADDNRATTAKQDARTEDLRLEYKQKQIAQARGLDKYYIMHNDEVDAYEKGVQAMRQLGFLMEQSVVQEKEKDWAIHGGIANGLAGPIAGVAIALNTMKDNEEIRARNAANREWGAQQRRQMNELADKAESDKPTRMSMYQIRSVYAAVFSWSPNTLYSKIWFSNITTQQNKQTGSVMVTADWETRYDAIAIDGTIRAKLYNANMKCVGCAYLNLPKTGTLGDKGTVTGICTGLPLADNYVVQLEPVDLWELTTAEYKDYPGDDGISNEEHVRIVKEYESNYQKELQGN